MRLMERAYAWLRREGRPLELALWEYFLRGGSREQVLRCLGAFQNDDGGFGHGLEPDLWLPQSSPMASWMAGQILVAVGAGSEEEMVKRLLKYLVSTDQVRPGMWPSVLPEYNDHPHAPWWHWAEDAQEGWLYNPSVELAAFLIHWSGSEGLTAVLGWSSLGPAVEYLLAAEGVEWHLLRNYWECLKLLRPFQERFLFELGHPYHVIEEKVKGLIRATVNRDPASWGGSYLPLPVDFVKSPADPLYPELKDLVEENLDFFLCSRREWGIWDITWSWTHYPQEFVLARHFWQAVVAVERYRVLTAFDWLE